MTIFTHKPAAGIFTRRLLQFTAAWLSLAGVKLSAMEPKNTMPAPDFIAYASSTKLTPDETYTVERLIDHVRSSFEEEYDWDASFARKKERAKPEYKPSLSLDDVKPAAAELRKLTWISLQRQGGIRPVRDLKALQCFPNVTGLALSNNRIKDLSPLSSLVNLRRLHLTHNAVHDLSPLANCTHLEGLDLGDNPIEDFSPLQSLPKLKSLSISIDQIPAFRKLKSLPVLENIRLGLETFDSFKGFPQMPRLRVISGAHVRSLEGLERFESLRNLVNLSDEFDSLEPLRNLKHFTHANILESRVRSLEPLSRMNTLRELWLGTEAESLDLTPLEGLPALHELTIKCAGKEPPDLARVRAGLTSWDVEFRAKTPRHTPSLELEVVSQETFNHYDTEARFNVTEADDNEELLSSELSWLDSYLEDVFAPDFEEEEDYMIPHNWGGARSRTVVLYSERAVEAFPRLVLGMQKVLCQANRDWIIYFQSDGVEGADFTVWVYPNKIVATEKNAATVRRLIKPK